MRLWASTHEIWFLCGCGVGVFEVTKHSTSLVLLVTVFTPFYKIRVEGAGSCWEYFVVGPLFLASKGQEWCHFAV